MIPFRALIVAALFLLKNPAYLQLPGITGESTDEKHKNWIVLESVSFGVSNASSAGAASSSRESNGRPSSHAIHVVKVADRSSAELMQAVANGKHFATAEIDVGATRYLLKDVFVSSLSNSGHAGGAGGAHATESITLNYATMEMIYPPKPGSAPSVASASAAHTAVMAAPAAPPTAPARAMGAAPAAMTAPATSATTLEQQLTQSLSGAGRSWVATEGRALSQNNGTADQLVAAARQSAQARFGAQPANVTNALAFLALMDATKADHNLAQLQPAIRETMGATNASAAAGLANLH